MVMVEVNTQWIRGLSWLLVICTIKHISINPICEPMSIQVLLIIEYPMPIHALIYQRSSDFQRLQLTCQFTCCSIYLISGCILRYHFLSIHMLLKKVLGHQKPYLSDTPWEGIWIQRAFYMAFNFGWSAIFQESSFLEIRGGPYRAKDRTECFIGMVQLYHFFCG